MLPPQAEVPGSPVRRKAVPKGLWPGRAPEGGEGGRRGARSSRGRGCDWEERRRRRARSHLRPWGGLAPERARAEAKEEGARRRRREAGEGRRAASDPTGRRRATEHTRLLTTHTHARMPNFRRRPIVDQRVHQADVDNCRRGGKAGEANGSQRSSDGEAQIARAAPAKRLQPTYRQRSAYPTAYRPKLPEPSRCRTAAGEGLGGRMPSYQGGCGRLQAALGRCPQGSSRRTTASAQHWRTAEAPRSPTRWSTSHTSESMSTATGRGAMPPRGPRIGSEGRRPTRPRCVGGGMSPVA